MDQIPICSVCNCDHLATELFAVPSNPWAETLGLCETHHQEATNPWGSDWTVRRTHDGDRELMLGRAQRPSPASNVVVQTFVESSDPSLDTLLTLDTVIDNQVVRVSYPLCLETQKRILSALEGAVMFRAGKRADIEPR